MPERIHRPRGQRRRETLLRAALGVISERGIGGTTHRAVAQAADVPVATTTYYFSSLDDLLQSALALYVDDEIARIGEVTEQLVAVEGGTQDIIRAVAAQLASTSPSPQFDLYVEAQRRPALRPVVQRSLDAYRGLAEGLLRHVGARDPEAAAPLVVALLDGFAVQYVAIGDDQREERVVEGLSALLTPFLAPDATPAA